jgi:hypothetical protein
MKAKGIYGRSCAFVCHQVLPPSAEKKCPACWKEVGHRRPCCMLARRVTRRIASLFFACWSTEDANVLTKRIPRTVYANQRILTYSGTGTYVFLTKSTDEVFTSTLWEPCLDCGCEDGRHSLSSHFCKFWILFSFHLWGSLLDENMPMFVL